MGADFLEVIAPQLSNLNTTGNRFLLKKGGVAAGYMVIMHTGEADDAVAHMKKNGVRVMWGGVSKDGSYKGFHLHPSDWMGGGVLPSIDSMGGSPDPDRVQMSGWAYAEAPPHEHHKGGQPKWLPQAQRTGKYMKLVGCTLQTDGKDPLEVAKRWSLLWQVPLIEKHEDGGVPAILFSNAVIRFVKGHDGRGEGMQRLV
jgi:hypothetical protein